jgi:hypothetical protein
MLMFTVENYTRFFMKLKREKVNMLCFIFIFKFILLEDFTAFNNVLDKYKIEIKWYMLQIIKILKTCILALWA